MKVLFQNESFICNCEMEVLFGYQMKDLFQMKANEGNHQMKGLFHMKVLFQNEGFIHAGLFYEGVTSNEGT